MTREEELKQAIEENLNKHRHETILNFEGYKKRVDWILQDPSILRHADPGIMRQSGWVREEEWVSVEELMHPVHETIMVYSPDMPQYPLFGYFNSNNVFVCLYNMHLPKYYRITHWKPLPQPPKQ